MIGLVGLASAGGPPKYGWSSSAAASSVIQPYSSASAVVSSSIQAYPSSSAYASSSIQGYPSSSAYVSSSSGFYPSSSASAYGSYSSSVPASAVSSSYSSPASSTSGMPSVPTCDCWSKCFQASGISSESELCGNSDVSKCIHDTCSSEEDMKYWGWYDSFCTTSSSSSYAVSSTSTISSSTIPSTPVHPTPSCWTTCFGKAGISSESELCGNKEVNKCIYYTCSPADDQEYWGWYQGFCPAPSSSVVSYSASSYSASSYGGSSYSVSSDGVSSYGVSSYSVSVTSPVTLSSSVPSATPTGNCWNACFAANNVESEASLCGNDAVSKCIHDTCSSDLDKAYWDWYNSFCTPASATVTTTSVCTETSPATSGVATGSTPIYSYSTEPLTYTTTYVVTSKIPSTPKESSPATSGLPSPPASYSSPVGPYSSAVGPYSSAVGPYGSQGWSTPYSYPATAVGTGYASAGTGAPYASASYAPVPATGSGAANKPGALLAVAMAGWYLLG